MPKWVARFQSGSSHIAALHPLPLYCTVCLFLLASWLMRPTASVGVLIAASLWIPWGTFAVWNRLRCADELLDRCERLSQELDEQMRRCARREAQSRRALQQAMVMYTPDDGVVIVDDAALRNN